MKKRKSDGLPQAPLSNIDEHFYGQPSTMPRALPSRRGSCPGCGASAGRKRDRLCKKCAETGVQAPPLFEEQGRL